MLFDVFGIRAPSPGYRLSTILIDPGHGGRDSGALRHWEVDGVEMALAEKDIVLDIGLRLADKLRRFYPDKVIMLTRDKDVYPTLEERVLMANSVKLAPREGIDIPFNTCQCLFEVEIRRLRGVVSSQELQEELG